MKDVGVGRHCEGVGILLVLVLKWSEAPCHLLFIQWRGYMSGVPVKNVAPFQNLFGLVMCPHCAVSVKVLARPRLPVTSSSVPPYAYPLHQCWRWW